MNVWFTHVGCVCVHAHAVALALQSACVCVCEKCVRVSLTIALNRVLSKKLNRRVSLNIPSNVMSGKTGPHAAPRAGLVLVSRFTAPSSSSREPSASPSVSSTVRDEIGIKIFQDSAPGVISRGMRFMSQCMNLCHQNTTFHMINAAFKSDIIFSHLKRNVQ